VFRLIPRDEEFFNMFSQLAGRLTASAKLLHELFSDPRALDAKVMAIKTIEHEADNLTIDRTFVTPIDREDIHMLASRLDDVIDLIDGTARRAQMFKVTTKHDAAVKLCALLISMGEAIEGAVKNVKKPTLVVERGVQVKRLEEEGDQIYHEAIGALFDGTPDPLHVIKWKELIDKIEGALDQCEDVANTLESIALKNG
jgi:uncharacterized protein